MRSDEISFSANSFYFSVITAICLSVHSRRSHLYSLCNFHLRSGYLAADPAACVEPLGKRELLSIAWPLLRRATCKQTECAHPIGPALVKHKALLTVDRVLLLVVICMLSDAMQKNCTKAPFLANNSRCTMAEGFARR